MGCKGKLDIEKIRRMGIKGIKSIAGANLEDEAETLTIETLYGEKEVPYKDAMLERCHVCKGKDLSLIHISSTGDDLTDHPDMEAGDAEPEQRFPPEKGNEGNSRADSHPGAGGQRLSLIQIWIHLSSVRDHITIGGFDIAFYGLLIALALLVGVFITVREAERTGQDPEDYYDLAIFVVIFGVIGARLYYVIFDWDIYREDLKSIFNLREGGLAIYGGILAAALTVLVFARVKGLSAGRLADTAALGLAAGQAIGRWGNFFNREAFGEYTDGLFAMRIPVDAVRGQDISALMREHIAVSYTHLDVYKRQIS